MKHEIEIQTRKRKKRIDPKLDPESLRLMGKRALVRGRGWIQKAEAYYREADRREAIRTEKSMEPWPKELCEACIAGKPCKLHLPVKS